MTSTQPPKDRDEFRIAIVCALPCEADAVTLLFDEFWDEISAPYERLESDRNTYITGRMGRHNVVLATLHNRGTINAATGSVCLTLRYPNIKLALLVGTCGGMPRLENIDAYLGDVVISKDVTQYDFGARYPDGHFILNDAAEKMIRRANRDIRTMLATYETEFMRKRLKVAAKSHLKDLQEAALKAGRTANYQYPGMKEDRLFPPDYRHEHEESCTLCKDNLHGFCKINYKSSCIEVGCDLSKLIPRCHQDDLPQGAEFTPEIFLGRFGSANTPVKDGDLRDELARKYHLDAFETEGAGMWDDVPTLIIKGISGYADSHSNKAWKHYASATAASVAKAVLGRYPSSNNREVPAFMSGMFWCSFWFKY
ncbi:Uncharacterized protein Y057_12090 [Fusarium fujikuroi]|nr:Uncharacterized protein LW93_14727 [Fusarium fujikuroi]KLO92350.1 Uncharacterized protein Y057_12090 [Fusarium fujikuroi]SCO06805.1 uncharacterized protein FFC1_10209 [Fusarium fujikuroi]SCV48412.1 uncharacterized protein FFB14_10365 [Fusarium fujikuroi]